VPRGADVAVLRGPAGVVTGGRCGCAEVARITGGRVAVLVAGGGVLTPVGADVGPKVAASFVPDPDPLAQETAAMSATPATDR
jgi:hypothetical protein